MLRVRMLSGAEVTSVPLEELSDVRCLKQRLTHLHGFPPRFRQRLLLHGANLEDAAELDCPMSLDSWRVQGCPFPAFFGARFLCKK